MSYDPTDDMKFTQWFLESFKSEAYISREIIKRLTFILKSSPVRRKNVIDFKIEEVDGRMAFTTTVEGFVFLGVLGKCILDIMADHVSSNMKSEIAKNAKESMEVLLQQNHKVCKCGYYNDAKMHFCGLCGSKLDN